MNHHFRDWPPTEEDIRRLVDIGTQESESLEFKREISDSDDLRKEACAFANTHGGEIVVGVEEDQGVAARIAPVAIKNPDREELRVQDIIRTATTPPIQGIKIAMIRIGGGHVIVLRVPASNSGPHLDQKKRIYIRSGTQSRPMEYIELIRGWLENKSTEDKFFRLHGLRICCPHSTGDFINRGTLRFSCPKEQEPTCCGHAWDRRTRSTCCDSSLLVRELPFQRMISPCKSATRTCLPLFQIRNTA